MMILDGALVGDDGWLIFDLFNDSEEGGTLQVDAR